MLTTRDERIDKARALPRALPFPEPPHSRVYGFPYSRNHGCAGAP
jgi:hypothetical protein